MGSKIDYAAGRLYILTGAECEDRLLLGWCTTLKLLRTDSLIILCQFRNTGHTNLQCLPYTASLQQACQGCLGLHTRLLGNILPCTGSETKVTARCFALTFESLQSRLSNSLKQSSAETDLLNCNGLLTSSTVSLRGPGRCVQSIPH